MLADLLDAEHRAREHAAALVAEAELHRRTRHATPPGALRRRAAALLRAAASVLDGDGAEGLRRAPGGAPTPA